MLKCPLCKHEPQKKKDGSLKYGEVDFNVYQVFKQENGYREYKSSIMYSCPKCGIMFVEKEIV